jgi:hypothetical protein
VIARALAGLALATAIALAGPPRRRPARRRRRGGRRRRHRRRDRRLGVGRPAHPVLRVRERAVALAPPRTRGAHRRRGREGGRARRRAGARQRRPVRRHGARRRGPWTAAWPATWTPAWAGAAAGAVAAATADPVGDRDRHARPRDTAHAARVASRPAGHLGRRVGPGHAGAGGRRRSGRARRLACSRSPSAPSWARWRAASPARWPTPSPAPTLQERRRCPTCGAGTERAEHDCGTRTVRVGGVPGLGNDAVNVLCGAWARSRGARRRCWPARTGMTGGGDGRRRTDARTGARTGAGGRRGARPARRRRGSSPRAGVDVLVLDRARFPARQGPAPNA